MAERGPSPRPSPRKRGEGEAHKPLAPRQAGRGRDPSRSDGSPRTATLRAGPGGGANPWQAADDDASTRFIRAGQRRRWA
jgi:hypothetical protein